jgi:hypothetical protein
MDSRGNSFAKRILIKKGRQSDCRFDTKMVQGHRTEYTNASTCLLPDNRVVVLLH